MHFSSKLKPFSTIAILGIDIYTYRRWIEFQLTPDMNWKNMDIDHLKPSSSFDIANDEELKKAFSWKITQPLLKHVHQQKGTTFDFLDFQLQFIKAYQFIKLKEEGLN